MSTSTSYGHHGDKDEAFSTPPLPTASNPPPFTDRTTLQSNGMASANQFANNTPSENEKGPNIFQINAKGKHWNDHANIWKETEITILEQGVERYRNFRPLNNRGSCTLFTINGMGDRVPAAETTYRLVPGRSPKVKLFSKGNLLEEFEVTSKSIFSRSVVFTSAHLGESFIWRYEKKSTFDSRLKCQCYSNVGDVMILERFVGDGKDKKTVVVATLIRNEAARPKGTRNCEGSGGRLDLADGADGALGKVMEVLVLSTLMVMLKKETDRLGAEQGNSPSSRR